MPASAAAVLDALGDPRRRVILERLVDGPLPVGVLAEQLPISRPAAQHLRVLKNAELVTESVRGTRHLYRLDRPPVHLVAPPSVPSRLAGSSPDEC